MGYTYTDKQLYELGTQSITIDKQEYLDLLEYKLSSLKQAQQEYLQTQLEYFEELEYRLSSLKQAQLEEELKQTQLEYFEQQEYLEELRQVQQEYLEELESKIQDLDGK